MKKIALYIICTITLSSVIVLTLAGGWYTFIGLLCCGLLYVSGELFPKVWKNFWVVNLKILHIMGIS